MSKFNKPNTDKTVNKSGFAAYKMTDKEKLVTQVLTTFFGEPKFYGDNTSELMENAKTMITESPEFVANLARYARKQMHLRSVSHALAALTAHEEKSKPFIKEVIADVIERPDDITEILALYLDMYGKPVPNGLKKALGAALCKFDAYSISKYSGATKSVKFKDVLRLTHVKPQTPETEALFSAIVNDALPKAERWETELSASGNTKAVWEKLIAERKLGYMAALRNLRNILRAAPDNADDVLAMLADKTQVLKSKQLPMRFYAAYRELSELDDCSSKALDALETAIGYSVENMPRLHGKTVIAIDASGSMSSRLSRRSSLCCNDVASLLAVLASKICDEYLIYKFDTEINAVTIPKNSSILQTASDIACVGGCTDISLPLAVMLEKNIRADRLIILTDNEINYSAALVRRSDTVQKLADEYRRKINPELWIHAVDLLGYGTQQFKGARTNIIAGWSERVIEFIDIVERGICSQVERIENYGA